MLRRFWTHWINLGLNGTDRYVSATPLYFGGGRTFAMSILFSGGTVVLFPPPFDADALAAELERVSATSTFLVPTQLRKLLEAGDERKAAVRKLRLLISSGAPLDPEERNAIAATLNGNFVEYYASTEGGGISLATPETRLRSPNSVGRPVFGVEVQCVSDTHEPLPPGAVGQLRYRGPGVASGYFGEADGGESPFRDGWFYPGDLASLDEGGHVELRGRRKDVIIRGGVNIYPTEIEQVLRGHEYVAEAAVTGAPSPKLGETVAAFVVVRRPVDADTLRAWCSARLAPYKVPEQFVFLGELPRNSAGKIVKAALRVA
jgi:acyl-CoA synthetase (AMP-forming)/AMP-acid ligase II